MSEANETLSSQSSQHPEAMRRYESPVSHPTLDQFVATIAALRAPDGCPWDREQTHASIAHNMIEEAYEAVDTIETNDVDHLREELGDVLLQVVLQSQIAADAGEFTFDDVAADVNDKMVRRHPHIFSDAQATDAAEVLDLWDQVKLAEAQAKGAQVEAAVQVGEAAQATAGSAAASAPAGEGEAAEVQAPTPAASATSSAPPASASVAATPIAPASLLDGVPTSFPALMQAQKISRKAVAVGFEWETLDDVWAQVNSEIAELNEAYAQAPKAANGKVEGDVPTAQHVEEEFGDVLFSLVNVARRMGIDSENALRSSCRKFRRRWAHMEAAAAANGQRLEDLTTAQQNDLWKQAKCELEG